MTTKWSQCHVLQEERSTISKWWMLVFSSPHPFSLSVLRHSSAAFLSRFWYFLTGFVSVLRVIYAIFGLICDRNYVWCSQQSQCSSSPLGHFESHLYRIGLVSWIYIFSMTQFSIRLMSYMYFMCRSHLSDRIWQLVFSLTSQSHSVSFMIFISQFYFLS